MARARNNRPAPTWFQTGAFTYRHSNREHIITGDKGIAFENAK